MEFLEIEEEVLGGQVDSIHEIMVVEKTTPTKVKRFKLLEIEAVLSALGMPSIADISAHISDSSVHFVVSDIQHSDIQEHGELTHAQIDDIYMDMFEHLENNSIHGGALIYQPLTLLNSWENYGGGFAEAGYAKDINGLVHLQGLVKSGTPGSSIVATLPVGYRPSLNKMFVSLGSGTRAQVSIDSNGNIRIEVGSATWTSLEITPF